LSRTVLSQLQHCPNVGQQDMRFEKNSVKSNPSSD